MASALSLFYTEGCFGSEANTLQKNVEYESFPNVTLCKYDYNTVCVGPNPDVKSGKNFGVNVSFCRYYLWSFIYYSSFSDF